MNLSEVAERYRKYRIIPLLIGIFLIGFSIRYLAKGPRIGPELDTWFHYRMVNFILDTGHIPTIDPLAYYPTGRPVWQTDLLGLPYFIGYTYKIVGLIGITLMDYMVAFPAIFTSLAAVPLYLLTKELTNSKTALLTALFWQIIPSTLTRTHAGFVDKESLGSIYIFLWLWLFIRSIKTVDEKNRRTFITPILAGIFMGFSQWTWGGTGYFILVISTSVIIYTVIKFRDVDYSLGLSIILMTFFGVLTMKLVQPPRFPLSMYYNSFIYLSLLGLSLLYSILIAHKYLKERVGEKNSKNALGLAALLAFAVAWVSGYLPRILSGVVGFVRSKILFEKSLIGATVSENMRPNLFGSGEKFLTRLMTGDLYSHFNVVFFLAPLGFLILLLLVMKRRDYASIFILVFVISGFLGMRSDVRLSFVLTPSFAILASYTLLGSWNLRDFGLNIGGLPWIQKRESELKHTHSHAKKQKARYKAETQLSNLKMAKLLIIILLFGMVASPTFASFSMLNGRKVDVPTPWYNAMIWIRDNTPEDSVIVSWWDYGYWEQALGKRRTVVDGGNAGPLVFNTEYTEGLDYRGSTEHRDVDMARMFTSSEDEALKYLRPYVDYEKVPTYVIVSYEEFGKSSAINHISQGGGLYIFPQGIQKIDPETDNKAITDFINNNRIEAYTLVNFGSYWQLWFTGFNPNTGMPDPEMKNKLLAKLLPFEDTGFGSGLKHFEKVYNDEINYVLIYRVK